MKNTAWIIALVIMGGLIGPDMAQGQLLQRFRSNNNWGAFSSGVCINCNPQPIHVQPKTTVVVHSEPTWHQPIYKHATVPREVNYGYQFVGDCKILESVDLFMAGRGQDLQVVPNDSIYIKLLGKYDTLKLIEGDEAVVVLNLTPSLPRPYLDAFLDDHTVLSVKSHLIKVKTTVGPYGQVRVNKADFIPELGQRLNRLGLLQNESFIGLDEFKVNVCAVVKVDNLMFRSANTFKMVGAIDPLGAVHQPGHASSGTYSDQPDGEQKAADVEEITRQPSQLDQLFVNVAAVAHKKVYWAK